jgi:3-phenylpropionate/trans-cinnamate dioxygenase ferredoxin reductase subunit
VELRPGVKAAAVETGGLALAGGEVLAADVVVTGIGVRPEVGWLESSDLPLANGVVVDEHLRAAESIVAVGDCAAWWSRRYGRRLRVEHWDTALNAPATAALTLMGQDAVYDPVPYFWSEQFGRMVQYAGHHSAADRVVWRGDSTATRWSACWLAGDRLMAVLAVSNPRDLVQGRRLIQAETPVDPALLADPTIPIRDVARK